jgi:hypothetical protein
VGLIPDIGTVRDKLKSKFKKAIYGFLSFGWTGSAKHWSRHETISMILAGLAAPLVLSVHTIVSFDFATSVSPVGIRPYFHPTLSPEQFFPDLPWYSRC